MAAIWIWRPTTNAGETVLTVPGIEIQDSPRIKGRAARYVLVQQTQPGKNIPK
jgi:hypothetical protein